MDLFFIILFFVYPFNIPLDNYSFRFQNIIWNFSDFSQIRNIFRFNFDGNDYYLTLFDILTKFDLPLYCNSNIFSLFSVIMCNNISKKCYPLVSNKNFVAKKFKNTKIGQKDKYYSYSNGIILSKDGEPVYIKGQYFTFKIIYEIYCNKVTNSTANLFLNPNAQLIKDIKASNSYHLVVKLISPYGCPSHFSLKLPQPTPYYNPIIPLFFKQYSKSSPPEINTNFSRLSSQWQYGTRIPIKILQKNRRKIFLKIFKEKVSQKNYFLYYQPSERIYCPFKNACLGETNLSSAWLCEADHKKCQNFGVYSNLTKIENSKSDNYSVIITHYHPSLRRQTEVRLGCDRSFPSGFIKFKEEAEFVADEDSSQKLVLFGHTSEICEKNISLKKSLFSNQTRFVFKEGDYKIDIDISDYNRNESHWVASVAAYGPVHEYQLHFQPAGGIPCPDGCSCVDQFKNSKKTKSGRKDAFDRKIKSDKKGQFDRKMKDDFSENSTIYLCHEKVCHSYGYLSKGINSSLAAIGGMNGGVSVFYRGSMNRSAVVTFECDRSQEASLRMPTGVKLFGDTLHFSVGASDACPFSDVPDPSPLPSVHIPMPKNTSATPTPSPLLSPNFFVRNLTHYISLPVDTLEQPVFRGGLPLLVDMELGVMYSEFSPWGLLECPDGWICTAGQQANLWGCWMQPKEAGQNSPDFPYCHPIGDKRICSNLAPIAPNNLDRGVTMKYCGAHAMFSEMRVECDRKGSPAALSLHGTSTIFHRSLNGHYVSYNMSSSLVCPKEFTVIPLPSPKPSPGPPIDPTKSVKYTFQSSVQNSTRIDVDMRTFQQSQQWTVFTENELFELSFIIFNPSQQVKCPLNFECIDSNESNIWKCSKKRECYSLGDSRCNLSFALNDENDIKKGISVVYDGGYGGFSFEVVMICDESRKDKLLEFGKVNYINSQNLTVSVSVLTSFACPVQVEVIVDDEMRVSPGSMFILALLIAGILYLSVGSLLMLLKTGVIEMPNSGFWREFIVNVKTGAMFLLACGKTRSDIKRNEYSGI